MYMEWFEDLGRWIEKRGGCREIYRDGQLYMKRHYLSKSPLGESMLHQFFLGDSGYLHNHPWWAVSRILKTGYTEMTADTYEDAQSGNWRATERYAGDWSALPFGKNIRSFHKVVLRPGTAGDVWTFFGTGPRLFHQSSPWGFLEDTGFISYRDAFTRDGTIQDRPEQFKGWILPRKA